MKSLSLFSGCMGLDLGFSRTGIHPIAAVECDIHCINTIKSNLPDLPLYDDVRTVKGSDILAISPVDIIIGGPPCQSFSTIGKRGGMEDSRGAVILDYLRLVDEIHPRHCVMENVRGILSAKVDNLPLTHWIMQRLSAMGYKVVVWGLNAMDYGEPQSRMRVFIIGSLDNVPDFPKPGQLPARTLRDTIAGLEDEALDECAKFSPRMKSFMDKIPEGGNWKSLSREDRLLAMGNATLSSGGLTCFYRRLAWDKPSPTLLASPGQRATTLCHPTRTRPLSVLEYRRIQGFPDTWRILGRTTDKYRMIGNAVPVGLASIVANAVKSIKA